MLAKNGKMCGEISFRDSRHIDEIMELKRSSVTEITILLLQNGFDFPFLPQVSPKNWKHLTKRMKKVKEYRKLHLQILFFCKPNNAGAETSERGSGGADRGAASTAQGQLRPPVAKIRHRRYALGSRLWARKLCKARRATQSDTSRPG